MGTGLKKPSVCANAEGERFDFDSGDGSSDALMNCYQKDPYNFDLLHFYRENKEDFHIL